VDSSAQTIYHFVGGMIEVKKERGFGPESLEKKPGGVSRLIMKGGGWKHERVVCSGDRKGNRKERIGGDISLEASSSEEKREKRVGEAREDSLKHFILPAQSGEERWRAQHCA